MNTSDDTEAIVAANLRTVRALSPQEWRAVNVEVNRLYRAVYKGRTIPYPEGVETFEEAGRYRLAHLAARILLDMAEYAVLNDDDTHLEQFIDALGADGRIPEHLMSELVPCITTLFGEFGPVFARVLRSAEETSAAVETLAKAPRDA